MTSFIKEVRGKFSRQHLESYARIASLMQYYLLHGIQLTCAEDVAENIQLFPCILGSLRECFPRAKDKPGALLH